MLKLHKILVYSKRYFIFIKEHFFYKKRYIFIVLALIFITAFGLGLYSQSENMVLKNLETALKKDKPSKVSNNIMVDGKKMRSSDLEPIAKYYSKNNSLVDHIIQDLKNNKESQFFSLKESQFLFLKSYKISIKTLSLKVNTNFKDSKVFINDKELDKTNSANGLIPGTYKVRVSLSTEFGEIDEKKDILLLQDDKIDLNLNAGKINLNSNFSDSKVFINDKDTGKEVSDIKGYGPVPLDKDINIYIQREFPWGTIKSDVAKVSQNLDINLNINMANDELKRQIDTLVNGFYKSVFNSLNSNDYSKIENSNEDAKVELFNNIKQESLILRNVYNLSELNTEIKNSEFFYKDNNYTANVVVNLNYVISKKLLPFIKTNESEMFLTKMQYNDGRWEVKSVQRLKI